MNKKEKAKLLSDLRAMLDHVLEEGVDNNASDEIFEALRMVSGERPWLAVTAFHMRTDLKGYVEVLAKHGDKWIVVFGKDGPGPTARDEDQVIDHMIHGGGIANLRDHGHVHGKVAVTPAREPTTSRRSRR